MNAGQIISVQQTSVNQNCQMKDRPNEACHGHFFIQDEKCRNKYGIENENYKGVIMNEKNVLLSRARINTI